MLPAFLACSQIVVLIGLWGLICMVNPLKKLDFDQQYWWFRFYLLDSYHRKVALSAWIKVNDTSSRYPLTFFIR
jgi:hypothetical protein